MYNKDRLVSLIREKAVSFGEVKLASGQVSNFYVDLSKVIMLNEGLTQIVDGFLEDTDWTFWTRLYNITCIAGPAMGAIPLVTAIMLRSNTPRSCFVRSEVKDHGKKELVEGTVEKGDGVLMLEDVVTTGGSLLRSIKAVEEAGGVVKRVYAVLDRGENTTEKFAEKGYEFFSLLTAADIMNSIEKS